MSPGGRNPARPRESTGRLCGRRFQLRRQKKSGKKSFVVFYSALWGIRECRRRPVGRGKRSCARRGENKRRGRARAAKRGAQEAPGESGAEKKRSRGRRRGRKEKRRKRRRCAAGRLAKKRGAAVRGKKAAWRKKFAAGSGREREGERKNGKNAALSV